MARPSTLYERAVHVAQDYLGPAGERFIQRQIRTHFAIEPDALRTRDIPELVNWVRLTFALLTDDAQLINAFSDRLTQLATPRKRTRKKDNVA